MSAMIPKRYLTLLFVCLTLAGLIACEPMAPAQSPQYVIVIGETPDAAATLAAQTPLPGQTVPAVTGVPGTGGVVNTPEPSATSVPIPTALPSPTPFVCDETMGQVFRTSFYSNVVGADVPYQVYVPPCFFDTLQRYPYVILLHGTGFDDSMFVDLDAHGALDRGISKGSLPPMVLVMPDGGAIAELNDQPDGFSYEDVILNELIPAVEGDFCLWGHKDGRAIGGISRGGFWAFSIAFRHPELFAALGGHSPHFQPDNAGPETNPMDLAQQVGLDKNPLRIYMDHATDDYVGAFAQVMSELLLGRNIRHEYVINPSGNHDPAYWAAHIADYLAFYGATWPLDVAQLPSCLEPSPQ